MSWTRRGMIAVGGVLIALFVWEAIRTGHDDPVTVDNPRIQYRFGFGVEHMVKERGTMAHRDFTALAYVKLTARNGRSIRVPAKRGSVVELNLKAGGTIRAYDRDSQTGEAHRQFVLESGFGPGCWPILNRCWLGGGGERLLSVRIENTTYCLDDLATLTPDSRCEGNEGPRAAVVFCTDTDSGECEA